MLREKSMLLLQMQLRDFFQRLVGHLNAKQIYFKSPDSREPLAIRKFAVTKERGLKVFFQNGMSFVLNGVKILRDTISLPFDFIIQGLQRILPNERQIEGSRPIVIPLFSFFSLLSLVGVFSLFKLL